MVSDAYMFFFNVCCYLKMFIVVFVFSCSTIIFLSLKVLLWV